MSVGMWYLRLFDFSFYSCSYEAALLSNGGGEADHAEHASVTEPAGRDSCLRKEMEGAPTV